MTRLKFGLTVAGALALALVARTGAAASFGQLPADAISRAAAALSSTEQVMGCHRACVRGPVWRWGGAIRWHRHVPGPRGACMPVRC